MYRQGDVLLVPVSTPVDLTGATPEAPRAGRLILAEGEATGHHHSLACTAAGLFALDGRRVLVVEERTPLTHQEHGAIEIAPGQYWVIGQREYTPAEIVRVRD